MQITIRQATEDDFAAILSLTKELADFQKTPERVTNTVEQMNAEKAYFSCFVAQTADQEIVGMASYFFAYYSWVGKSLYLDDLYVKQSCRGQKVGSRLLEQIFDVARKENCKRVRWLVSSWNTAAIDLYRKCGATIYADEFTCDVDGKGIREFKLR
jgi:ribosomal protein S18 acetylase RimI-like enzyme